MPRQKKKSEYYVIDILKERMEEDENFTKDQIRDFDRRVNRTYSMKFIIMNYQKCHKHNKTLRELNEQKKEELLELIDENEDLETEIQNLKDKNCEQAIEIQKLKNKIKELQMR